MNEVIRKLGQFCFYPKEDENDLFQILEEYGICVSHQFGDYLICSDRNTP